MQCAEKLFKSVKVCGFVNCYHLHHRHHRLLRRKQHRNIKGTAKCDFVDHLGSVDKDDWFMFVLCRIQVVQL